ncbi:hypothetical protein FTUN_0899 [Frigoriglobus tundricola]|uniref:Uncharacterized protein n=1 Tax=Frigoriglobus tundricola TaxID=2774151 RepID=A0A6M5YJE4_9BACT|nr:hypothetical protein FTUN_0899 [Frigoriglobus tundricola]
MRKINPARRERVVFHAAPSAKSLAAGKISGLRQRNYGDHTPDGAP